MFRHNIFKNIAYLSMHKNKEKIIQKKVNYDYFTEYSSSVFEPL